MENVMVCVTQQKTSKNLILKGWDISSNNGKLFVVHVVNENESFLNSSNDGEALQYLFDISSEFGAEMTVLRAKDIANAIIDFAINNNITHIVLGNTKEAKTAGKNINNSLKKALTHVQFTTI